MNKSKYSADALRAALEKTVGNITRAAKILGTTKTHGMRLVKKHNMNIYAHELRLSAGHAATGKPPTSSSEQRRA